MVLIPQLPALKRKRDNKIIKDNRVLKYIRVLLVIKAIKIEDQKISIRYIYVLDIYKEAINNPKFKPQQLQAYKNKIA